MKPALAVAMVALLPACAIAASHPFNAHDLVTMERVSAPLLSPDGKQVAFGLRQTDYEANKGKNGIWIVPAAGGEPRRVTDAALNASGAQWSSDGANLYFLAPKDGTNQLWLTDPKGSAATQATSLALDVNNYKLSPDGEHVLLSIDVFPDCASDADVIACTKKQLDARDADKVTGTVYD